MVDKGLEAVGALMLAEGNSVGTRTVGAFATVGGDLEPLRPPWAAAAGAEGGGPAEGAHQLLTPFVVT